MANKKYEEVKNLTNEELQQQLESNKLRLQRLKFNHAISPLENPNVIGETRKLVARLNTEIRKRQLENA
jgi:large subunit ribosomal protein L29